MGELVFGALEKVLVILLVKVLVVVLVELIVSELDCSFAGELVEIFV